MGKPVGKESANTAIIKGGEDSQARNGDTLNHCC